GLHYLDDQAAQALTAFRPLLGAEPAAYERWRYQLTHLPAGPALLAALAGAALSIPLIGLFLLRGVNHTPQVLGPPYPVVVDSLLFSLAGATGLVGVYHTIRQLSLISHIQATHARISLFDRAPAHAFSALTARTAICLVLLSYGVSATLPVSALLNKNDII